MRAMLGLSGTALTNGLTLTGPRGNHTIIRDYLNTNCGMTLPP